MTFFGILFFLIIGFLFIRSNIRRGQNFVRAYYYLLCLDNGKSQIEANHLARDILKSGSNPDRNQKLMKMAEEFARVATEGKQLPVINMAIERGYLS